MTRRHATTLRARDGPWLDPASRLKYLNEIIRLQSDLRRPRVAGPENVVNGVKTIMVNETLRTLAHVAFPRRSVIGRPSCLLLWRAAFRNHACVKRNR